jgi:uncharacterized membrane protein YidH (DUF202 family)
MTYMKITLFLLIGGALYYMQIRRLIRRGEKRDTAVYTVLMLTAIVVGTLFLAEVRLPSPAAPLKAVFEPVGKWFFPGP